MLHSGANWHGGQHKGFGGHYLETMPSLFSPPLEFGGGGVLPAMSDTLMAETNPSPGKSHVVFVVAYHMSFFVQV